MTMNIRPFDIKDREKVKKLITDILNDEFLMDKNAYPVTDLDSLPKIYGGRREIFFVGDDKGKIIGTAAVKEESRDIAILRRLFVDPKFRGKGYGSLLIDKALDFCRKKGYREVVFHVSSNMRSALDLCAKRGFKEKENLDLGGINIVKLALNL